MNKDPLISILGDEIRAKVLRLVAVNKHQTFKKEELKKSLKTSTPKLNQSLKNLVNDGIIINKKGTEKVEKNVKGKIKLVKQSFDGIALNKRYTYKAILEDLILHTIPSNKDVLIKKLRSVKGLKVLVTTGIFAREYDASADILIVGDGLDEKEIASIIKGAESIIGRELKCAILDTNDFVYRFNIHDQLVRGILDYPHFIHIDSLGIVERG